MVFLPHAVRYFYHSENRQQIFPTLQNLSFCSGILPHPVHFCRTRKKLLNRGACPFASFLKKLLKWGGPPFRPRSPVRILTRQISGVIFLTRQIDDTSNCWRARLLTRQICGVKSMTRQKIGARNCEIQILLFYMQEQCQKCFSSTIIFSSNYIIYTPKHNDHFLILCLYYSDPFWSLQTLQKAKSAKGFFKFF